MEVINCFEVSARRPKSHAKNNRSRAIAASVPSFDFSEAAGSVRETALDVKGRIICFGRKVKAFIHALRFAPVAGIICMLPYGVTQLASWYNDFAKPVAIEEPSENSFDDILKSAMNDFAFDYSASVDSDGNVLNNEGGKIAAKNLFKESVTYQKYTVKSGDTISGICMKFGLSNISTLIAVNNISNVRTLSAGQKLRIPSADGLIHKVVSGESLASLSSRYNVSIDDLLDINELSEETLAVGQEIFVPGARMDAVSLKKAMGELFVNPLKANYRLTSRFGYRKDPISGADSSHTGIDMACPTGTSIYSAMSGTVSSTGFSSVFGNYVIVNHIDGYQTLYAHMSKILVKKGAVVTHDSRIGLVGSTGYSTGPHLHFSVYKNHKLVDPLSVIKGK